MSEPVKCMNCGAVSYNDPGKTDLYCGKCYRAPDKRLVEAVKEMQAITYFDDSKTLEYMHGVDRCIEILYKHIPEVKVKDE